MSILKVTREEMLSRAAAARLLSTLAAALANSDQLQVTLGGSSIKVQVPDEVRCEIEGGCDELVVAGPDQRGRLVERAADEQRGAVVERVCEDGRGLDPFDVEVE